MWAVCLMQGMPVRLPCIRQTKRVSTFGNLIFTGDILDNWLSAVVTLVNPFFPIHVMLWLYKFFAISRPWPLRRFIAITERRSLPV